MTTRDDHIIHSPEQRLQEIVASAERAAKSMDKLGKAWEEFGVQMAAIHRRILIRRLAGALRRGLGR